MASYIMAVYNTVESRIEQLVIDATNYDDPSFNPPNCVQVHLDPAVYEACQSPEMLLALVQERLE